MSDYKVSVVIPVYNTKKYIKECIDSVIKQSFDGIEVICVDDASTDGSNVIIDEYEKKYEDIRVIHCDINRGQAHARNIGINEARGQYIYFLDSDDMMNGVDAIDLLYHVITESKADVVMFDSEPISEIEGYIGNNIRLEDNFEEKVYTGMEYFAMMIRNNVSIAVWKQFWKKSFLLENNMFFVDETSPHEDLLFTFEAILLASKVQYVNKKMHIYRIRDNSSMTTPFSLKRLCAYEKIYKRSLLFLNKHYIDELVCEEVYFYLSDIQRLIHEYSVELVKLGEDINDIMNKSSFDNIYLRTLIMSEYEYVKRYFSPEEYERLSNSKNIYLYGGGKVSTDIIRMLEKFKVYNYQIVVSSYNKNIENEKKIISLNELEFFDNEDVMIVGVGRRLKNEVVAALSKKGIDKYIYLL